MAIPTRTAQKPCIYWAGQCTAVGYFGVLTISCYNNGACDGAGTCIDCSRFDSGGLKIHTLSYVDALRTDSLQAAQLNQVPANVAIYNLRAKLHKCCYWSGQTIDLSINSLDKVSPVITSAGAEGTTKTRCSNTLAASWQEPWVEGSLNTSIFPCNGAKTGCPYYTGPAFQYLTDPKMERGSSITAAQIMELRYYSRDWSNIPKKRQTYEALFSVPNIWAWPGDFDDAQLVNGVLSGSPTEASLPRLAQVSLFIGEGPFDSFESSLYLGPAEIASTGTSIDQKAPAFPTLIKELGSVISPLSIKWPPSTSPDSPFLYNTFRYGFNKIYVIVAHNTVYPLYAVNVTKNPPPAGLTDEQFILYMLQEHPDEVYSATTDTSIEGTLFLVDLVYQPELNIIKVFSADDASTDGSMYSDTCYVQHAFYHAHLAQTSFIDNYGQAVVEPWVDRFVDFSAVVQIKALSKNKAVPTSVLWDSMAYNRETVYSVEVLGEEIVSDWVEVFCNVVAITISNPNINPVQTWKLSGVPSAPYISSSTLGIWVDRSANPNVASTEVVEMEVIESSSTGFKFPANVVFIRPKTGTFAFDRKYDKFRVVFAYTEYRQGPVPAVDVPKLKYPQKYQSYIQLMPYNVSALSEAGSFSVAGLSLAVRDQQGAIVSRLGVSHLEEIIRRVEADTDANERRSLESFARGGDAESSIDYLGTAFYARSNEFNAMYAGKHFDNGDTVTLANLCSLLSQVGYYEGTQEYRVVFSDSSGRPVGVKRLTLLMQSAVPSCRDVEMYYKWRSSEVFVDARDHFWLLARDYKPLYRSTSLHDAYYEPYCGDHSLQMAGQTFYTKVTPTEETFHWDTTTYGDLRARFSVTWGTKGALWYPYKACTTPRYKQNDPFYNYVLCHNFVEGFGGGRRRSYWEATRGPDIYRTVRLGPIFFVGCTWSWTDGSYQTVKEPIFAGFTRIRSGHLFGSYQTDRESLRVSRHHLKRNIAVRNELVRNDGFGGPVSLSPSASSLFFDQAGNARPSEKPVWVHMVDDISVVNRTTPMSKHPFSNLRLVSEGSSVVGESFSSQRVPLRDVVGVRDLVRADDRNEAGQLVYSVEEPRFQTFEENSSFSGGKDIYWVFKDQAVVWAWLELHKEPERALGGARIGGVFLYNPVVNAWQKDFDSATVLSEGVYDVVYTPPVFNEATGVVQASPTIAIGTGPARGINWLTGVLEGASGGKDPYDPANHTPPAGVSFSLYGRTEYTSAGIINGFLADDSGYHDFEYGSSVVRTFRGLGIKPTILVNLLPSTDTDILQSYPRELTEILGINTVAADMSFEFSLRGLKVLKSLSLTAQVGLVGYTSVLYAIPTIYVDGLDYGGSWHSGVLSVGFVGHGAAMSVESRTVSVGDVLSANKFKKIRLRLSKLPGKYHLSLKTLSIIISEPVALTEQVKVYEQRLNVSTGSTGTRHHKDLLYYYGRTFADFGLKDVQYDEAGAQSSSQDLKWLNRTVRDVLPMFYFMDPTGTVFDFPKSPVASISDILTEPGGPLAVPGPLLVHMKGQTVITQKEVSDPVNAQAEGTQWRGTVAPDEISSCPNARSEGARDEYLQECLYKSAASLLGQDIIATYASFWHPDEEAFFKDEVGLPELPSWTLTLKSTVPPFSRVMRHQDYGCSGPVTNEYYDGRVHRLPPWRAVGHLLYLGSPSWNWSCTAILMNKLGKHLGEDLFEKRPEDYAKSRTWPPDYITNVKVEKPAFYYDNPKLWDHPSTYSGGTLSPGIPVSIGQALNYSPGGIPRGWLTELALFPQTKSWPISDSSNLVEGYRKFGTK